MRLWHATRAKAAVREAVGPNIEIGVDVRASLNVWGARRVAQQLEPLDIAWLEEPILFDNADTMAEFARSVRVPVATGEQLYTRWEFRAIGTKCHRHHPIRYLPRRRFLRIA